MAAPFCHLHVHTQYSLLDGACRIEQTAQLASRMQMPAVAVTDHGNLFGAVSFHRTMKASGVKPIIGYEGYLTVRSRHDKTFTAGRQELYHLTLLAENQTGYRNLLKLASLAYLEGLYYKPRMDWDLLADCREGLICLSGCLQSRLNTLLVVDATAEAEKWLGGMRELFGPEHFYIELQDHGLPEQRKVLPEALRLARKLDIPVVATNDVHYLRAEDRSWHDVLLCISTRSTLNDPNRFRLQSDQLYFKTPEEMARLFADEPDALANTLRIAEMCELELDGALKYPTFRQEGVEDNTAYLRDLTESTLQKRYGKISDKMRKRLDYELGVIQQMGYVDYFLIVWDFVRFALENAIPVGMRGSGASSLVAHALGLTDINPMDYDLIFSRFMDPERREKPDIDIDLCEIRREEVIAHVRERYGENSTAQIITFGTLQARNCVRDVGRVLDVPLEKVDRLAKMIPMGPKLTLEAALRQAPEVLRLAEQDEEVARILDYARRIEGLPRHVSTHAAGVVIADRPLWELTPLYKSGEGLVMTQWAMDDLDEMGMLKMDFLGLRTLTIIDRTLKLIAQRGQEPPSLDAAVLDLHDPETFKLISKGTTVGVFQLGSEGMRRLLRRLEPSSIEDLIAVVALYRPGPLQSGMVEDFIARKNDEAEVKFPHPALEQILRPTYGVIVYQEQIMRIVNQIAGMSMAEALTMINAISKKSQQTMEKAHQSFVEGAVANGLDRDTAESIYSLISHFAGYGFNKAHSAAYAFIAFRTAFLKAHYPTEFMAAGISSEMGDTDRVVELMEDCAQLGIKVLPPDVNQGGVDFTVLEDGVIRFGLAAIKNAGFKAVSAVIAERESGGAFASIFEFCERVDPQEVTRGTIEALTKAGCFDELPGERAQQLAIIQTAMKAGARVRRDRMAGQTPLFGVAEELDPAERVELNLPGVPPLSSRELARQESEALGLYVRYDPLEESRDRLRRLVTAVSTDLGRLPDGEPAIIGGIVESIKKSRTRDQRQWASIKVLDLKGNVPCILWPRAYERYQQSIESEAVLLFRGTVSHQRGTGLHVDEVIPIQDALKRLVCSVIIAVPCGDVTRRSWSELHAALEKHKGPLPVLLDLAEGGLVLRCRAEGVGGAVASDGLAAEIEALLGPGSIRFGVQLDVQRRARFPAGRRRAANEGNGY